MSFGSVEVSEMPKTPNGLPVSSCQRAACFPRAEARARAVQEEVALLERRRDGLLALEDDDFGKALREQLVRAVVEVARPEPHLGVDAVLLQQLEQAGVVGDVADVLTLPRIAQQDARRASWLRQAR